MDLRQIADNLGFKPTGRRREWRGDCPSCGYRSAGILTIGKDGAPALFCASCSDGRELRRILRVAAGGDAVPRHVTVDQAEQARDIGARIRKARDLWQSSIPIRGTIAEAYLKRRCVFEAVDLHRHHQRGPALRYHPDTWNSEEARELPALLAACRDPVTGELRAVHRTYLSNDGSKASVITQKKVLGPWAGCAVMLHDAPLFGPLVVAEGAETALAASIVLKAPAWATGSAGNLARLALPEHVAEVIIGADPDPPGQRAAQEAAKRWLTEGRKVRIATPHDGSDFNDLLMRRRAREASHG